MIVATGFGFTLMVIGSLVNGFPELQSGSVTSTVIMSPFWSVEEVNVVLLLPSSVPFIFHWNKGVGLGVTAVKVTGIPSHIVEAAVEIVTLHCWLNDVMLTDPNISAVRMIILICKTPFRRKHEEKTSTISPMYWINVLVWALLNSVQDQPRSSEMTRNF